MISIFFLVLKTYKNQLLEGRKVTEKVGAGQ